MDDGCGANQRQFAQFYCALFNYWRHSRQDIIHMSSVFTVAHLIRVRGGLQTGAHGARETKDISSHMKIKTGATGFRPNCKASCNVLRCLSAKHTCRYIPRFFSFFIPICLASSTLVCTFEVSGNGNSSAAASF